MLEGITVLTQTELYDVNEALVIIPAIVVFSVLGWMWAKMQL